VQLNDKHAEKIFYRFAVLRLKYFVEKNKNFKVGGLTLFPSAKSLTPTTKTQY